MLYVRALLGLCETLYTVSSVEQKDGSSWKNRSNLCSINHLAASHKILLWRFDSIFEPWPLPCRDFEAVEFLRVDDVSRTPSPQEGQGRESTSLCHRQKHPKHVISQ